MPIKPTVGRIVYFKTRGSADGVYPPVDFASIITDVHEYDKSDSVESHASYTVNLITFGPNGLRFEHEVVHGQEPGQWDWMPFQKDQQARLAPGTPITEDKIVQNDTSEEKTNQ